MAAKIRRSMYIAHRANLLYRSPPISFIKDKGNMNTMDIMLITNFRLVYQRPVCPERPIITIKKR